MKRTKRPTFRQKKMMVAAGLDWRSWNVGEEDNLSLTLVNKKTGRKKVILT